MYDVIIVGAGPAGLTAAIYAARKKLNLVVLTREVGGQALWSSDVENYLGFKILTGVELVQKFTDHIKEFGVDLEEGISVTGIKKTGPIFEVETNKGNFEGKSLIIASGKIPRRLNIPGETKFLGRGLAYCATCDAPLFSGMDVIVVGGGNSALDAALQLVKIASKVYMVTVEDQLGGDEIVREKVLASDNLELFVNSQVKEITGEQLVSGAKIENMKTGEVRELSVRGVFVEIGSVPSTQFCKDFVKLDDLNEIVIDCETKTSVDGLFAAGDVSSVPDKQIIIAAGEGSKSALAAYRYLTKQPSHSDCENEE